MYHFWFTTFKGEKLRIIVLHEVKEALYLLHLLERKVASSMFIHSDAAWQEIDLLSCLKTSYETVDF